MSSRPRKSSALSTAFAARTQRLAESASLAPGLYIVATPIGNLGDLTLRALETLKAAELIACEDTRVTAKLLTAYGIKTPMTAYHDHNADAVRPELLAAARRGAVALVSDAGTPLISDPGYKLVRAAQAENIAVTTLPGPSAVTAAMTLAGLPTDRFLFAGFLPNKKAARQTAIAELAHIPATLVFFESAQRIEEALGDLLTGLGDRPAALTRELTKRHEDVQRGHLSALRTFVQASPPRGEIVLVIAPPATRQPATPADIDALLSDALKRLSVKDAAAEIASITGASRRAVYARALELSRS